MRTILIGLLLTIPQIGITKESTQPWLQPEVIQAAMAINLSEEQLPLFQQAMTNLVEEHVSESNKLLRRNNVENLKRKIKTATNRAFKEMDRTTAKFLTQDQVAPYLVYCNLLKPYLADGVLNRNRSSNDAMDIANSALSGGSHSH